MTLEELINQQLSLGKKLGEIRVQHKSMIDEYFIPYFKAEGLYWHGLNEDGYHNHVVSTETDWHLYTEPKVKKKYWLWYVKIGAWRLSMDLIDESGIDTQGCLFYNNWDNLEKRKVEDAFIEIEVDSE